MQRGVNVGLVEPALASHPVEDPAESLGECVEHVPDVTAIVASEVAALKMTSLCRGRAVGFDGEIGGISMDNLWVVVLVAVVPPSSGALPGMRWPTSGSGTSRSAGAHSWQGTNVRPRSPRRVSLS